jgi:hypothetical protein
VSRVWKRRPLWDYNNRAHEHIAQRLAFSISSISRWSLVSLSLVSLSDCIRCNGLGVHLKLMAVVRRRSFTHGRSSYICVCPVVRIRTSTYYIIAVPTTTIHGVYSIAPFFLFSFIPIGHPPPPYHVNCSVSFAASVCPWVCQLEYIGPSIGNGQFVLLPVLCSFPPPPPPPPNGIEMESTAAAVSLATPPSSARATDCLSIVNKVLPLSLSLSGGRPALAKVFCPVSHL